MQARRTLTTGSINRIALLCALAASLLLAGTAGYVIAGLSRPAAAGAGQAAVMPHLGSTDAAGRDIPAPPNFSDADADLGLIP